MLEILEIGDLRRTFIALQPALIRFVVARGASYEDAHDVVQDLYLKLERVPVDTLIEARAYLYRMADNLMLDRHRASQRRVRRDDAWTETNFDVRTDYDEQPSADRVVIARQSLSQVNRTLDTLPLRTADIFRRFRIEGETQKDIAADLGISLSAVEKHLQRAYGLILSTQRKIDADRPFWRRRWRAGEPFND
ncbi:MAG: RNA polymerase sigma factor [Sphingomonas sp.]|nr:RNA polymerase sigma factor [Sphingomonas sp.]